MLSVGFLNDQCFRLHKLHSKYIQRKSVEMIDVMKKLTQATLWDLTMVLFWFSKVTTEV